MRRRVTKVNRWKKVASVAKATAAGAGIGAATGLVAGGLHGGLQEHLKLQPKIKRLRPIFSAVGDNTTLSKLRRGRISYGAGKNAVLGTAIGMGVGALAGGARNIAKQLAVRRKEFKRVK